MTAGAPPPPERTTFTIPCNSKAVTMIDDITFARQAVRTGRAREIRDEAHLTREAMAQALGVAVSTIYKWETTAPRLTDQNAAKYGALLRQLQAQATQPDTESQPA